MDEQQGNVGEISAMASLNAANVETLYSWIDEFPLSRPKRNMHRDFADGVLTAEILHSYFPKLVDIHNYIPANGIHQKKANWETLNRKVLCKLNYPIPDATIQQIITGKSGAIESVLLGIKKTAEELLLQPDYMSCMANIVGSDSLNDITKLMPSSTPKSNTQLQSFKEPSSQRKAPQVTSELKKNYAAISTGRQWPAGEPMVPAVLLEEQQHELLDLKETIRVLEAKVERLEELVKLKDMRIQDLSKRLEQMSLATNLHRGRFLQPKVAEHK